jgi:hypothetical protein
MKRWVRNPYAAYLREHGYKVQVTDGEGEDEKVIREYFVSPEEVASRQDERNATFEIERKAFFENLRNERVQ